MIYSPGMNTGETSMDEPRWEAATVADTDTLLELIRQYYEYDHIPFDERTICTGLAAMFHDFSYGRAWLIKRGQEVLGYTILCFGFDLEVGGRLAVVTDLYFKPEHRRKGLGRRTLGFLEDFCRASGVMAMQLAVERDNTEAQRLYKASGFVPYDRIPMNKALGQR